MDKLLTVQETAKFLGVSRTTVYRYVKSGKLPHIRKKFGIRCKKEDLDAWLEKDRRTSPSVLPILYEPLTNLTPLVIDKAKGGLGDMAKAKSSRLTFVINGKLVKGTIFQRKTREGIRWHINYAYPENKRVRKVAQAAQNEKEAILFLKEELEKAVKHASIGTYCHTFKECSDLFMKNYSRPNKDSWKCDHYALEAHLKPFFGHYAMDEITPLLIDEFKAKKLETGLAKSSINRLLSLLKTMFNVANTWKIVEGNPAQKVKLYSERDNKKQRILSPIEEHRLLDESADHLKPIILTALNTGMRRNEILTLTWDRIDLNKRTIEVIKTKSKRNRTIPINDTLFNVFSKLERQNHAEYVFPNLETKEPFRSIRHSFENACRRASIKGLRFHDLRHSFSCRLISKNCDVETLRILLGHHSITVTERYIHSGQTQMRKAVDLLNETEEKPMAKAQKLFITSRKRHLKNGDSLFSIN